MNMTTHKYKRKYLRGKKMYVHLNALVEYFFIITILFEVWKLINVIN